jgi:hypothetical protein
LAVDDPVICKAGATAVALEDTQQGVRYDLIRTSDGAAIGSKVGTGNALSVSTDWLVDTTQMYVRATIPEAACVATFEDTLLTRVEKVKAIPHIDRINAHIGEEVLLYHHSEATDHFYWSIPNSPTPAIYSQSFEPETVQFEAAGAQLVQLVAVSEAGCADTAQWGLTTVDGELLDDDCWSLTNGGPDNLYDYPYPNEDYITELMAHPDGGVYVSGIYAEATFRSMAGQGIDSLATLGGFVAHYDEYGVLKWMVRTVENQSVLDEKPPAVYSMTADGDGNLYLTGRLKSGMILFNDGTIYRATEPYYHEGFVMKLTPRGVLEWIAPMRLATGTEIALDAANNIYVNGLFHHNAWLESASGQLDTIVPPNLADWRDRTFISKYSPEGEVEWALFTGHDPVLWPFSVNAFDADSQGNIYIGGAYRPTFSLRSTDGTEVPVQPTTGGDDFYLAKYNTDGVLEWIRYGYSNGEFSYDGIADIAVGPDDRIYITGAIDFNFTGEPAHFTAGSGPPLALSTLGYYLVCYDASGQPQWGAGIGLGRGAGTSLVVGADRIAVTGHTDTGPYDAPEIWLTDAADQIKTGSLDSWASFIAEYDLEGNFEAAYGINGQERPFEPSLTYNLDLNTTAITYGVDDDLYIGGRTWYGDDGIHTTIAGTTFVADGQNVFLGRYHTDRCGYLNAIDVQTAVIVDNPNGWCPGSPLWLEYSIAGQVPAPGNVFEVERSDPDGIFGVEPFIVGVLESDEPVGTIPFSMEGVEEPGSYQVRLRMSDPAFIGPPVLLPEAAPPVPEGEVTTELLCAPDFVELFVPEGAAFSWSPPALFNDPSAQAQEIVVSNSTTVWVDVDWFGCGNFTDTIHIAVADLPVPVLDYDGENIYFDYAFEGFVHWYFDGDFLFELESNTIPYQGAGTYQVEVFDFNGCSVWSEPFVITSTHDLVTVGIKTFPNPFKDQVILEVTKELPVAVECRSLNGQLVGRWRWQGGQQQAIDCRALADGMYLLNVIWPDQTSVFRIVKQ